MVAQSHAGMWRRNGYALLNQVRSRGIGVGRGAESSGDGSTESCWHIEKEWLCLNQVRLREIGLGHTGWGTQVEMSHIMRKPVFGVFDQVGYKGDCSTTEDGKRLEILDFRSSWIV